MLRAKDAVYNESDNRYWTVELVNKDGTAWCHEWGGDRRIVVEVTGIYVDPVYGVGSPKVRPCSAS